MTDSDFDALGYPSEKQLWWEMVFIAYLAIAAFITFLGIIMYLKGA